MEPLCPKCGAHLDQDFGVVACPQCSAVLSIDLDGNVQVAGDSYADAPPAAYVPITEDPIESPIEDSIENSFELLPLAPAPVNLSEIADYGNQEQPTSPLSYTVLIENIDDASLRSEVEGILAEPKLKLNSKELVAAIRDGRLELNNLSPAKAIVLVSLLRKHDLKISWSQNLYA